jgi:two-component system, LuxR family, response regulator FixJ
MRPVYSRINDQCTIFVIESDGTIGKMIGELLSGTNLNCEVFRAAHEFFDEYHPARTGCLVFDTPAADMSGWQLQRRLAASQDPLPLVFVASRIDVSMAVALMRGGAVHVLEKPVRPMELWSAVQEAVDLARKRRLENGQANAMREQIAALNQRERQVLKLMNEGKSIRLIAQTLKVGIRAVELRQQHLMAKLQLKTRVELTRFAIRVGQVLGSLPELQMPQEDLVERDR